MPLYEFACQNCDCRVELLVSANANPKCPECDKPKLQRQLSVIATPSTSGGASTSAEACGTPRCCGGG